MTKRPSYNCLIHFYKRLIYLIFMAKSKYPDAFREEVTARAMAAREAGQKVKDVSLQYNVPVSTISTWMSKRRIQQEAPQPQPPVLEPQEQNVFLQEDTLEDPEEPQEQKVFQEEAMLEDLELPSQDEPRTMVKVMDLSIRPRPLERETTKHVGS